MYEENQTATAGGAGEAKGSKKKKKQKKKEMQVEDFDEIRHDKGDERLNEDLPREGYKTSYATDQQMNDVLNKIKMQNALKKATNAGPTYGMRSQGLSGGHNMFDEKQELENMRQNNFMQDEDHLETQLPNAVSEAY